MNAYKVVGPLPKREFLDTANLVDENFTDAQYRYGWCRSGGFDGTSQCFHLVRPNDNAKVGFFGIAISPLELEGITHVFTVVDGAWLFDGDDQEGRAVALTKAMYAHISGWLNARMMASKKDRVFHLHLNGLLLNDRERQLCGKLESRLARHCRVIGCKITSDLVDRPE